jgi:deazaflavin-dependent oxidoreductase (nitroreductase family)
MALAATIRRPWWHRAALRFGATRAGAWFSARTMHHLDRQMLRLTRGRGTLTSMLSGLPVVWLTTTGARSGREHTVPLCGIVEGEQIVLIASNFGQARNPAWYHNLRALPCATVAVGGRFTRYRCREADAGEYATYWREAVAIFPGWAAYHRRATRHSPMLIFTPLPATDGHCHVNSSVDPLTIWSCRADPG